MCFAAEGRFRAKRRAPRASVTSLDSRREHLRKAREQVAAKKADVAKTEDRVSLVDNEFEDGEDDKENDLDPWDDVKEEDDDDDDEDGEDSLPN